MGMSLAFHIVFAVIGMAMPFSLEGFAFFSEAIFLGIYLYGWNRVSPLLHWLAGCGCDQRRAFRCIRGIGKRLDECAGWVRRCQRATG
jgi:cytochrome bd-type quinol oxidase subunit 1